MANDLYCTSHPLPELPSVIIADILSRLEIKNIGRLRSTCKEWDALTKDPQFIRTHLSRSSQHLLLHSRDIQQYTIIKEFYLIEKCEVLSVGMPYSFIKRAPYPLSSMTIGGSCNGLLCILHRKFPNDYVYIYNPTTGESLTLPDLHLSCLNITIGFGCDPLGKTYKVFIQDGTNLCNIITVGEHSWRSIIHPDWENAVLNPEWYRFQNAAFSDGLLHWVFNHESVVSFDISQEKFKSVKIPDSINADNHTPFRVLVLGETLTLVSEGTLSGIGDARIWHIDGAEFYEQALNSPEGTHRVLLWLTDGSVLLHQEGNGLAIYHSEEKKFCPVECFKFSWWEVFFLPQSCFYQILDNSRINEFLPCSSTFYGICNL